MRIEKLFKASENGFRAAAFHEKCDNISDTLVLVRTEFGKTIGGFTHYPWLPKSPEWFSDAGRRAFIFSLDMQEKFVPISNKLIFNLDDYGPVFGGGGGGFDICIRDGCNNKNNSFCNFPSGYNRAGGNKLEMNQESWKLLCGTTNGFYFKVE